LPMRTVSLITLALVAAAPAAANASDYPPDGGYGLTVTELYVSHGHRADARTVKEQLDGLNALCASKRARDQVRCEKAWRKINAAHARLQAEKAKAGVSPS